MSIASNHNAAPEPLVADSEQRSTIGLDHLTYEDLEQLGRDLDDIRQRILDDLGQEDADYIRRVVKAQSGLEVAGRALMFLPFLPPVWLAGVAALSLSKILDAMEIGHNVLHGQYDWMNDPKLNSRMYEWDLVTPTKGWKYTHNFIHHTYTNIYGKDRDIGYGLVRIDPEQKWHPAYLGNLVYASLLAFMFEWGVLIHDLDIDRLKNKEETWEEFKQRNSGTGRKIRGQLFKDYLLFPALSGPFFLTTVAGNLIANVTRNLWAFAIIFCGHFPADVECFTEEEAANESRGQWYLRQALGSANITGSHLFHIMTGNLSHQIEHHLFPDIPSRRYPGVAAEVRALCEKYDIQYNTGRLSKQLFSVARKLAKYSVPNDFVAPTVQQVVAAARRRFGRGIGRRLGLSG
jgi:fatty acid desaturase